MKHIGSPIIVYSNEKTTQLREYVLNVKDYLIKNKLKGRELSVFFRTNNNEGRISHKSTGNRINIISKGKNLYFVNPVIINYDNRLTEEEIKIAISELRYVSLDRYLLVNLNKEGEFSVDLYQNTNTSYNCWKNIS